MTRKKCCSGHRYQQGGISNYVWIADPTDQLQDRNAENIVAPLFRRPDIYRPDVLPDAAPVEPDYGEDPRNVFHYDSQQRGGRARRGNSTRARKGRQAINLEKIGSSRAKGRVDRRTRSR